METRTIESELAHFGVKGMKWGVRKRRKTSSETSDTPSSSTDSKKSEVALVEVGVSKTSGGPKGSKPVQVRVIPGKPVQTRGGVRQPTTNDAVRSAALKQLAKKSGPQALTNEEMSFLVSRLNLEEKLSKVAPKQKSLGKKFVQDWLPSKVGREALALGIKKLPANTDPRIKKGLDYAQDILAATAAAKKNAKAKK